MYKCDVCGNRDDFNETREYAVIHYCRNEKTDSLEIFEVEYGDITTVKCLKCESEEVSIDDDWQ